MGRLLHVGRHAAKDRVARLHAEVTRVLQDNDVKERLKQVGMEAGGGTPEQLGESVTREIAKWAKVFKDANLPRQ
ncbi:MAG: tripartite tricarboxylate transporter substrate-binding protein [Burkholderiaceae bacterium]|nr:tripartite tricarboxylate transporter substrate-binding protein [Burkholderiaceae bacterium]